MKYILCCTHRKMFLLLLFVNFESHLSKHVNCTSIKVVQENLYTCYFKTPNTCLIEAASHIVVHDSDRIGPIQLKFTFLEIPPKVQGQTRSNLHFSVKSRDLSTAITSKPLIWLSWNFQDILVLCSRRCVPSFSKIYFFGELCENSIWNNPLAK